VFGPVTGGQCLDKWVVIGGGCAGVICKAVSGVNPLVENTALPRSAVDPYTCPRPIGKAPTQLRTKGMLQVGRSFSTRQVRRARWSSREARPWSCRLPTAHDCIQAKKNS
jgi:hypothetical protein